MIGYSKIDRYSGTDELGPEIGVGLEIKKVLADSFQIH